MKFGRARIAEELLREYLLDVTLAHDEDCDCWGCGNPKGQCEEWCLVRRTLEFFRLTTM